MGSKKESGLDLQLGSQSYGNEPAQRCAADEIILHTALASVCWTMMKGSVRDVEAALRSLLVRRCS